MRIRSPTQNTSSTLKKRCTPHLKSSEGSQLPLISSPKKISETLAIAPIKGSSGLSVVNHSSYDTEYSFIDMLPNSTELTDVGSDEVCLTQSPTLDELVEYIDPPKAKRLPRKRKQKGKVCENRSSSSGRLTDEDLEVEQLKSRLANRKPLQCRVKPCVRADWLRRLSLN